MKRQSVSIKELEIKPESLRLRASMRNEFGSEKRKKMKRREKARGKSVIEKLPKRRMIVLKTKMRHQNFS